ncbi:MAG: hypothetical protein K6D90_07700 [Lachnospiraceae bacterium]|nr:hypothetical protein [Lachnospiraceae bacterium]
MENKSKKAVWKWAIGIGAVLAILGTVCIWKLNNREPKVHPEEDKELIIEVNDEEEEQKAGLENASMQTSEADPYHGPVAPLCVYDRQELPRIVCWGDSLTEESGYSYPEVLKSLTDAKVINYGLHNDSTRAIAVRAGAVSLKAGAFVIPEDQTPVPLTVTLSGGKQSQILSNGSVGVNPCMIGGVRGYLALGDGGLTFFRSDPGLPVSIADGTPVITQGALNKNKEDVVILFSGANDGLDKEKAEGLIEQQQMILDHLGSSQYIVISLTYADVMEDVPAINAKMKAAYGEHFLDFYDYMIRYGLEDAGIEPTDEDKKDMEEQRIPSSLLADHVHGTEEYYKLLAEQVFRKLMFLGYLPLHEDYRQDIAHNPRVVFWGDSITECTNGGDVTFPNVVKELAAEDGITIDVKNYGVYAEKSSLIAARAGGNPMRLNKTVTIPADLTPVEVEPVSDMFGWEMLLVFGGDPERSARAEFNRDNSINPCVIAGVEGNLSMDAKENKRYFTRLKPGEEVVAREGEQIRFWAMRDKRKDDILVIWSGTNDELTPEKCPETFKYIHSIIDFTGTDRYIVINMQKIEEMPQIDEINELFAKEFGEHCLDIYSYLLNDAMDEAGLTPTEEDKEMLKERRMPMSIRSDMAGHFNEAGYTMIGHEIYRKLRSLGYL